jgi:hypothetical protein
MLARRVVTGLAYQYGLDRIGPVLAVEGTYGTDELQARLTEILASDQVSKLAKRLLARPSASAPLTPTEVISLYRSYVQEWEGLQGASGIGRTAA